MLRGLALALAFAWTTAADPVPNANAPTPNANAVLLRVKAGIRAGERPNFVVYTLDRRDSIDGVPDFLNSYRLRVWCRTSDRAALSRRVSGARATGPAEYIMPEFDKPIDPGPPTADLLDVIRQTQNAAAASPAPAGAPAIIGSVSVVIERDYHVTYAGADGSDDHLRLEARRDPERNRLTDLYVDRTSYALHRAVASDHLYVEGRSIPERFEIDFGTQDGIPVIVTIHGQTDYAALGPRDRGEAFHEVTYRFTDIAFPADLPAWYFAPKHYGEHRSELPPS